MTFVTRIHISQLSTFHGMPARMDFNGRAVEASKFIRYLGNTRKPALAVAENKGSQYVAVGKVKNTMTQFLGV